jgi:peptidoglycan/xylan/chitin deacetylase (PgdA/CDA1 family)
MYHELLAPGQQPSRPGEGYARYVTPQDQFRSHLDCIRQCGLRGVSIGDMLGSMTDQKVVGLTFDDGCASDAMVAAPMLEEFGFSATFYLTVHWLGMPGFLTHDDVRQLAARGFDIGSHSLSHAYLSDLPDAELTRELQESRDRLTRITGTVIRNLSCPGGRWSERVSRLAREAGYESVADSSPLAWSSASDRFRIGRFAMTREISAADLNRLLVAGTWKNAGLKTLVLQTAKNVLGNRRYDQLRSFILDKRAR